jgi:hypothetical protein
MYIYIIKYIRTYVYACTHPCQHTHTFPKQGVRCKKQQACLLPRSKLPNAILHYKQSGLFGDLSESRAWAIPLTNLHNLYHQKTLNKPRLKDTLQNKRPAIFRNIKVKNVKGNMKIFQAEGD